MHIYRTHTCADLRATHVGDTIRLSGWVHRVRDHGGVLFIDLRDHYGMTQVLCDPDSPVFGEVEKVRSEWCIRIDGEVKGDIVGMEKVVITKTGKVQGNIVGPRVTLEDGAKFKGSSDMDPSSAESAAPAPKPVPSGKPVSVDDKSSGATGKA